jgi:glutamyl-tRNA synthetase
VPAFAHVPLILGTDGKRLSKRHGATAVGEYAREGILPQAMFNFLTFLGWSPGDDREVFTPEELVEAFSLDRVLKKGSVFDPDKLAWMNGQHLQKIPDQDVLEEMKGRLHEMGLPGAGAEAPVDLAFLVELLKPRSRTLEDLASQAVPYLAEKVEYEEKAVKKHWAKDPSAAVQRLERLRDILAGTPWEHDALESGIRGLAEELGVGAGKVIHPLRLAITGLGGSPGIFDVLLLLGRERTLQRIDRALDHLGGGTIGSS